MLDPNKPSKWWITTVNIWKSYVCTAVEETNIMTLAQLQIARTSPTHHGCHSSKRKQHAPALLNSNSKLDGICKKNFQNHLINESGKIRNLHINKLNIQVKNAIFSKDRVCSMCSIGKCHIFGPKGQQN